MKQLPLFVNLAGQNVVLIGEGAAADAKRRLIERAGGICVPDCPNTVCSCARIAFVAIEEAEEARIQAARLRGKGMLVNVVDQPADCDFTTPAIVERDPVLIAVSTGGASAGMAKAIRQRLETLLPGSLGALAKRMLEKRVEIKKRWPEADQRRRAIDAAMMQGGALDPFAMQPPGAVEDWLQSEGEKPASGLHIVDLLSPHPDDLTLRTARLLGEADIVFHDAAVPDAILNRARADAERCEGTPTDRVGSDNSDRLIVYLRLPLAV